MVHTLILPLFVALAAVRGWAGVDLNGDSEAKSMLERINQRYDDFFRRRHEIEEADRQREKAAHENDKVRKEHVKMLEKAREEYVKNRKQVLEDPRQEKKWDEEQKARKEEHDLARRRYVQRRDEIERLRLRGRAIPEKKEYDIED